MHLSFDSWIHTGEKPLPECLMGDMMHMRSIEHTAELSNVDHDGQVFYLNDGHRAALKTEAGVEAWHFEQHQGEAVYIPAGCAHQVRNLRPCIKVTPRSTLNCF